VIVLFENVQLRAPEPCALYCAVKVVLPAVSPLTTVVELARCNVPPARMAAFASEAASVFAPLAANDIKHAVELALPTVVAVTTTRTLPEAGTTSVADGPTVVRLP
jgi:hypothetical protein